MSRILLALVASVALARPAQALDITACETIVPDYQTGVLQSDLSCAGAFIGVRLQEHATLDMNGHKITGTFLPDPPRAVECTGASCRIIGPGEISNGDFIGVTIGQFTLDTRLRIEDVDIHDCREGINGQYGFSVDTRVRARNVNASDNTNAGIWADRITAVNVTASGNGGPGLAAAITKAVDVTASNNGASGIFGDKVGAKRLAANNNGDCGVRVLKAALKNSVLTGNNGFGEGIDLATFRPPRVVGTTCGKSGVIGGVQGSNWGVCTDD